jgi:hypothetical protein
MGPRPRTRHPDRTAGRPLTGFPRGGGGLDRRSGRFRGRVSCRPGRGGELHGRCRRCRYGSRCWWRGEGRRPSRRLLRRRGGTRGRALRRSGPSCRGGPGGDVADARYPVLGCQSAQFALPCHELAAHQQCGLRPGLRPEADQEPGQRGQQRLVQRLSRCAQFDGAVVRVHGQPRHRRAGTVPFPQGQSGPGDRGLPAVRQHDSPRFRAAGYPGGRMASQHPGGGNPPFRVGRPTGHGRYERLPARLSVGAHQGRPGGRSGRCVRGEQRQAREYFHLAAQQVGDRVAEPQQIAAAPRGETDAGPLRHRQRREHGGHFVGRDILRLRRADQHGGTLEVGGHREAQVVGVRCGRLGRTHQHARRYLLHHTATRRTRGHPAQRLLPGGRRGARAQFPGRLTGREAPPSAAWPGVPVDEQRAPGCDQDGPVGGHHLQLPGVGDPVGHTGPARLVVTGAGHDEPDPAGALRTEGVEESTQTRPEFGVRRAAPGGGADHHRDDVPLHADGAGHFGQGRQREGVVLDRAHQQQAVDVLDGCGAGGSLASAAVRGCDRIPGAALRTGPVSPARAGS